MYGSEMSSESGGDDVAYGDVGYGAHASHRVLENQFQDRFNSMKHHYEQRISQLSGVIQETCMSLVSDELLQSMRNDATSSAFMPAHISEILNVHIEAEREKYIHTMVENVSVLEATNRTMTSKLEKQHKRISHLESENRSGRQAESHNEALEEKVSSLEAQCAELAQRTSSEAAELRQQIIVLEREKDVMTVGVCLCVSACACLLVRVCLSACFISFCFSPTRTNHHHHHILQIVGITRGSSQRAQKKETECAK